MSESQSNNPHQNVNNTTVRPTKNGKRTTEWVSYQSAKSRCQNENDKDYPRYGGRGVEFRFSSFEEFIAELGPKPEGKRGVDRILNDGHYEVGNVRWATDSENSRNRRSATLITLKGRTQNLVAWAKELGIGRGAISARIKAGYCEDCIMKKAEDGKRSVLCPHKRPK